MAKGSEHLDSLLSGNPRCWRNRERFFMQLEFFLFWPAAIAHSKMLRNYLPLRGQRKIFHILQVIFHSSPEVGERTCMKMWLVQIWCPLSLKLWVRWCKIGLLTVESQPTDWGSNASATSHLSFWRKVGKEDTNEAHHSKRTVFSGSDYPLTFGDSEDGGE